MKIAVIILAGLLSSACTYRFTNIAIKPPDGIQTIAIEAVYDTSREVIPHELLWRALQNEFSRRGRLRLTSAEKADAILRVQISSAAVEPAGTPNTESVDRDPQYGDPSEVVPSQFKNLRIAGNYTTIEAMQFTAVVEVFDLRKRKQIFNRSYQMSGSFRSIQASNLAQTRTGYLLYEEGLDTRFRVLSEQLSRKIVTDILL